MTPCPQCSQPMLEDANVCPHCGFDVAIHRIVLDSGGTAAPRAPARKRRMYYGAGCLAITAALGVSIWIALSSVCGILLNVQCANTLRMLSRALHAYHEDYGSLPPAFVADESGRPMHSWRVLILPYLDQKPLYDRYRFDEPWDGPNNSRLLSEMPPIYSCPEHHRAGNTMTSYAAALGPRAGLRGSSPVRIRDMTDGPSSVAMVGETTRAFIPWTKPADIDVTLHPAMGDPDGFGSRHAGVGGKAGAHFLFADGSVRWVPSDMMWSGLFTIDGNDPAPTF